MKTSYRILLPTLVVFGAVGGAMAMFAMRPTSVRGEAVVAVAVVEVVVVNKAAITAEVHASGTVIPAREVVLTPEVNGRVVWQSPNLVPGGRVAKGEVLLRLDPRDYRLAVQQEESRVKQAEIDLTLEQGKQEIARQEWERFGDKQREQRAALALRKPQLAEVEAQLRSARSGFKRARLALERTTVRAPFNALVTSERVETGQLVGPTMQVATLVGTDRFWVIASVPVEHLPALMLRKDGTGSRARVALRLGPARSSVREGRALRLAGGLDETTRTARVVIAVERPLDEIDGVPLLTGSYVDIAIEGKPIEDAVELPREALHGDAVWIVDDESKLARREVRVAWRTLRTVIVTAGLEPSARVVTSPLSLPIAGMLVEITRSIPSAGKPVQGAEGAH
ncbi:MAG: efflux RND transporter periplasmic adaptor subunit [Proteobacteria bacterium]|nr:efflux RND transporter periplasmic adaptor subunit [Pseudomonadota bacterium]